MSNTCDDTFKRIAELQQQNKQLQEQAAERERAIKAGEVFLAADVGDRVVVPGSDGVLREFDPKDVARGYQDITARMDSAEVQDMVERGLGTSARPNGAEGNFQNYDRIVRETDTSTVIGYARLAEALGLELERIAPEDYAFITKTYGQQELAEILARAYSDMGVTVPDVMAKLASDAAGFGGMVEKMARIRLLADRSKKAYLKHLEEIDEFMEAMPGGVVPPVLKQRAFTQYKLALVSERHFAYARRRTGQTLRSLQDDMGDARIRDEYGDEIPTDQADEIVEEAAAPAAGGGTAAAPKKRPKKFTETEEFRETIGLTPKDTTPDSHFGRVLQAVDDGPKGRQALKKAIVAAKVGDIDPKAKLDDPEWFNTHMMLGNALVKDSQLSSLNTQLRSNLGSGLMTMVYGPLETLFKNGYTAFPVGTKATRMGMMEKARIHAKAAQWSLDMTRAALKADATAAFNEGVAPFATNPDLFGRRMHTNAQDDADMLAIHDAPYPGRLGPMSPENVALWGAKLQWSARKLFGAVAGKAGVHLPLKTSLRALGTVDNSIGKYHFLFHLKTDLEIRARSEAVVLGLNTPQKRNDWVQAQIKDAIYQATPTEANIKAYREKWGLKGSDVTDDEIAELITDNKMVGAPTLATPEARAAMDYSDRMRFQNNPGATPGSDQGTSFLTKMDRFAMDFRKDWRADALFPYWRSPINAAVFDNRLSSFALADTIKMITRKNNTPEFVARTKAAWTMSAGTLAVFSALEANGLVEGGLNPDPRQRNRIMGIPYLGGIPILNTLFLWKDIKSTLENSNASSLDGEEAIAGIMQVLTAQIVRSTGLSTLQQLVTAMADGNKSGMEKVMRTVGFIGSGRVPFIGFIRQGERALGLDGTSTFRDGAQTPKEMDLAGADDPIAQVLDKLRALAYDTLPGLAQPTGAARKTHDWLGSPIGHIHGIDLGKTFPGFPGAWPNDPVYAQLDQLDQLMPPLPLLGKKLDGIGMSGQLQREFTDIYGTVKGNSLLGRNALSGRKIQVTFPMPISTVLPDGARMTTKDSASIDLAPFLEKHVKGKTVIEAFRSLFADPVFQAMEEDPKQTSDRTMLGQTEADRRRRPAQLMVSGIKLYYEDLTRDELERRAASGKSPEAAAWSRAKTAMADEMRRRSLEALDAERPGNWIKALDP